VGAAAAFLGRKAISHPSLVANFNCVLYLSDLGDYSGGLAATFGGIMDLPDVMEQLSTATRSLKLSASWLESQTDEQIREIGSGDWLPLTSTIHNLEERVIRLDREFNRGEEARLDLANDLIEPEARR
jgi:hypothetical protein